MNNIIDKLEYDNYIIVLVKFKKEFNWYVSEREFWILNYKKYAHSFDPYDNDFSDRFDIPILDNNNCEDFFKLIKDRLVTDEFIEKMFKLHLPIDNWDNSFFLFPSLFIDFDQRKLYTLYDDGINFEYYLPKDWEGSYQNFYDKISDNMRYWKQDNIDWLNRLIEKHSSR